MKRIALLSAAILGTLSWLSVSLASASVAARAEYSIAQVKALAGYANVTIVGMDAQGDLVATVYRGNRSLVVIVTNAGSRDEHLVKLGAPPDFTNASAAGI
ncbi:MAG TPA: hypothetical protein VG815_20900, partial [Chloroflexota bacterium]|nr:hypothetical protein [Chloroflexota bacterium]